MATQWTDSTLLLGLQADLTTPTTLADNEMVAILGDAPKVTFATELAELELMTGQVGAAPEKLPGRRSGSLQFSVPLQGFKTGRNAATEDPGEAPVSGAEVIPPWLVLVANALGCNVEALAGATLSDKNTNFWRGTFLSCSDYAASGVTAAGTDSTHVQGDAGEGALHTAGQLIAAAQLATIAPLLGWIKTKVSNLMTLFEAGRAPSANYDDNTANVYGTATAWQSDDQPRYLTAYWTGPDAKFCYVLSGLVCESFKLQLDAGQTPTIEFTYRFYDFTMDKTKGGLVVPDSYTRTPQLVGTKSGQLMLDGSVKCGLESVALEWKATIRESKCHHASQGIGSVSVIKPRTTLSFSVPHDVDDVVYDETGAPSNVGSHQWQSSLELGTTHSVGVYVGPSVGKCLALLLPAGRVSAVPGIGDREGGQAYSVVLEATSYSGDSDDVGENTSANCPINSVLRIAGC